MKNLTNLKKIIALFDNYVELWHKNNEISFSHNNIFVNQALEILCSNYKLWHLEDLARDINADDKIIADVKRKIDRENQNRNDNIEKLDILIYNHLNENNIIATTDDFNSETPGSIIDRITILSLKIYHMDEQTKREDASKEHIEKCIEKLEILKQQRSDLVIAFEKLIKDILSGKKKHKIYFQFKMYNDPTLNPVLYRKSRKSNESSGN